MPTTRAHAATGVIGRLPNAAVVTMHDVAEPPLEHFESLFVEPPAELPLNLDDVFDEELSSHVW